MMSDQRYFTCVNPFGHRLLLESNNKEDLAIAAERLTLEHYKAKVQEALQRIKIIDSDKELENGGWMERVCQ